MRMGYAEVDITPESSVTMIGFNRIDNLSKGVLDPLLAQVSIWEDKDICCLITIDNIGFNIQESDHLRGMICSLLHQPRERIMLSFSHTHSAVNTAIEKEYFKMLCHKVCDAVNRAKASMTKVSVGWGNVSATIGENRNPASSANDRRIGFLKVCSENAQDPKMIILRVTAHCNVLKRDNYLISADYFGAIRKLFKKKYHCPIMIIQGAAGNIAPKYYNATITPFDAQGKQYINSSTALEDIAHIIFNAVDSQITKTEVKYDKNVNAYSKFITLRSKVPNMDEAQQIANEALQYSGIDGTDWINEVNRLRNQGISFQSEQLEIQYFCIGDWCLCGIPNEAMTELSLEIEQLLQDPYFYFNGYTNGCTSYFPTKEEFDLGGFEVFWSMLIYFNDYGRVYPYDRESYDIVKECVISNYKR